MTQFGWIVVIFLAVVALAVIIGTPSPEVPRRDPQRMRGSANRGGG
jgi:hypothetical protein